MFKRGFISVYKNKVRSLVFGLILLAIATLVLSSLSIKSATQKSMEQARMQLAPQVTLGFNWNRVIEDLMEGGMSESEAWTELKNNRNQYNTPITNELIRELVESQYVDDYNYSIYTSSLANGFSAIGRDYSLITEGISEMTIIGTYNPGLLNRFNQSYEIVDGDLFGGSERNVGIISRVLADENNLAVGDSITIDQFETYYIYVHDTEGELEILAGEDLSENITTENGWTYDRTDIRTIDNSGYTFEIVGLFETEDAIWDSNVLNEIFLPIDDVETIAGYDTTSTYEVVGAVLYIDDPANINKFYDDIGSVIVESSSFKGSSTVRLTEDQVFILQDNNEAYEAMVEPLSNVLEFVDIILIIILVAGVAVITLLIGNSMKDRKYEIGVLLSLGEKKAKIAIQYMLEMLMIGYVAFSLAIVSSNLVANDLGNTLVENMTQETKTNVGKGGYGGKGDFGKPVVETDHKINVNVTSEEILMMYILGSGIIIASSIIPSLYISRYQPKKILSSRN